MVPSRLAAIAALGSATLVAAASIDTLAFTHAPCAACFANHALLRGPVHLRHQTSQRRRRRSLTSLHIYRKFHDYAWDKLLSSDNADADIDTVPEELKTNTSPVKGAPAGTDVVAEMRSVSQFPCLQMDGCGNENNCVLRLARSAFLETQTPTNDALITPMTIHVLNLVLFPTPHIRDPKAQNDDNGGYVGLPIYGADIVSLPGNKHLVALDFQPVLPLNGNGKETPLLPPQYAHLEQKLEAIHSKYQKSDSDEAPLLPWGGDIPSQAERFFSPYALWTRLGDDDAIDTVQNVVWAAFQEYTDLYLELMSAVQEEINEGTLEVQTETGGGNPVTNGQLEYLEYRRTNDPARPMLQRLYGEEWSERVIGDVLFPDM